MVLPRRRPRPGRGLLVQLLQAEPGHRVRRHRTSPSAGAWSTTAYATNQHSRGHVLPTACPTSPSRTASSTTTGGTPSISRGRPAGVQPRHVLLGHHQRHDRAGRRDRRRQLQPASWPAVAGTSTTTCSSTTRYAVVFGDGQRGRLHRPAASSGRDRRTTLSSTAPAPSAASRYGQGMEIGNTKPGAGPAGQRQHLRPATPYLHRAGHLAHHGDLRHADARRVPSATTTVTDRQQRVQRVQTTRCRSTAGSTPAGPGCTGLTDLKVLDNDLLNAVKAPWSATTARSTRRRSCSPATGYYDANLARRAGPASRPCPCRSRPGSRPTTRPGRSCRRCRTPTRPARRPRTTRPRASRHRGRLPGPGRADLGHQLPAAVPVPGGRQLRDGRVRHRHDAADRDGRPCPG